MEQKPIGAEAPLTPPTADVAQAYLDEIDAVVGRREARVDRRRMAWLALADAIVLAAYVTVAMFGYASPGDSSRFMAVLALLFVWMQLSGEVRENYGGQARRVGISQGVYIGFALLIGLGLVAGIWLQFTGVSIPLVWRFAPGAAMLAVFGGLAVRDLRRNPTALLREHAPFTPAARYATAGLGVVLGVGVWSTAGGLFASFYAALAIVLVLVWGVIAYAGGRLPALGAIWRWEHWAAFAVGCAALAGMTVLSMHTSIVTGPLAASVGAGVSALSVVVAVAGGRHAG